MSVNPLYTSVRVEYTFSSNIGSTFIRNRRIFLYKEKADHNNN